MIFFYKYNKIVKLLKYCCHVFDDACKLIKIINLIDFCFIRWQAGKFYFQKQYLEKSYKNENVWCFRNFSIIMNKECSRSMIGHMIEHICQNCLTIVWTSDHDCIGDKLTNTKRNWFYVYTILTDIGPVSWGCRIHWLHLYRELRFTSISLLYMPLNNLMVRLK